MTPTPLPQEDAEQNGEGPAGTYGCACPSRDARTCIILRYGWTANCDSCDERCECLCHQWEIEDD